MQYDVQVNGQPRQVAVDRRDGRYRVVLGTREWMVDIVPVGGHLLSLLIERDVRDGAVDSCEISVATDAVTGQFVFGLGALALPVSLNTRRRFGRKDDTGQGASGPQRLVAPMPGKVVRLLGKPGDRVAHRQPVIVIEAMKMENELRASRDGTLAEVLVQEGQSVEAGTLLAVITPP